MILIFPFQSFFIINLILRTFFVLSSEAWFSIWAGLEFNLISFIPLLMSKPTINSTEASIKYFIIQALASVILLLSIIIINTIPISIIYIILISALLVKIGAAPFHQWVPNVISAISWSNVLIILTWQKIAPIFILIKSIISSHNFFLLISASLSALVGGIGGINQTQARTLIAFSSIGHIGWITAAIIIDIKLTIIYFIIYVLTLFPLTYIFNLLSFKFLNSALNLINIPPSTATLTFLLFFSLGGIPPFLGFLPKLLLIKIIISYNLFIPLIFLIIGSLINLYYYFTFSVIYTFNPNFNATQSSSLITTPYVAFFSSPLFLLPPLLSLFYR